MPCYLRCFLIIIATCCAGQVLAQRSPDSARFYAYILKGNDAYKQKSGYASFVKSLAFFDTAQAIADRSGDTLMMAEAVFARGRVYDGWNKAPLKTIALFREATELFRKAGAEQRHLYAKHLVAHAYDKMGDSTGATTVLRELLRELATKDTATLHALPFTAEMALIATEVRAYALADSILRTLSRRAWIANDPDTYDYLNHYYLTQSRLDVYWRGSKASPYLDSLSAVAARTYAIVDRLYYAYNLASLYAGAGAYEQSWRYTSIVNALRDSIENRHETETMLDALVQSEITAERRKLEYQDAARQSRIRAIWVLSLLLLVITVLSIYLYQRTKKYRAQSRKLEHVNSELDKQIVQVEVLNKEIQHRVKNNLSTIYSLLQMQESKTDNEEVIAHLQAARLRVESIAALHNQLLAGKGPVDFSAYIRELIAKVVDVLSDGRSVVTHIVAEPVALPLNACFALSLILNEWVTNSIKYAAGLTAVLEINVSIKKVGAQLCVEYSDGGKETHLPATAGLGTEIIALLAAQLAGTLTTPGNNPYHYKLCIPHESED